VAGAPIPELNLPPPNPFIPKRLDVEKFEVQEKALRPDLLKDTPLSRLWYKRDDTWWLPKTNVDIKLTRWVVEDLHRLE
jgi:insulysin